MEKADYDFFSLMQNPNFKTIDKKEILNYFLQLAEGVKSLSYRKKYDYFHSDLKP
jgi:serine/threonine protein kinase